jgi:outer membrane protein OmpA-like peptidoglycan-associated protein
MNLIEGALAYLNPEVTKKASALVGESPPVTHRALEMAVPAIVAGLAGECKQPGGAKGLLRVIEDAGLAGTRESVSDRLGAQSGEELLALGKDLLGRVFGGRMAGVTEAAAGAAGVTSKSMTSLFSLAAPLVFGGLGSAVHGRKLDAADLAGLLGAQRATALSALPASVLAAFPPERVEQAPRPVVETRTVEPRTVVERKARPMSAPPGISRWWPLALLIPLAIIGARFLRRQPTQEWAPHPRLGAGVTPEAPAGPEVAPPVPAAPSGPTIEEDMERFLASPGQEPSKRFFFEDLNFEYATPNLMPTAGATLDRVGDLLRENPNATITVEGHTDSTGVPADNLRLSRDRAEAVKNALVARGVAPERITTKGYGQDRPTASNDSAEGRAKNRRTEIVLTR